MGRCIIIGNINGAERRNGFMSLSINSVDLRLRGLGYSTGAAGGLPSGGVSFSQALAKAYRTSGGANYENYFQAAAETYQIPENLLKAVAKAESDFNPNAVSHCGAQGIMQLMPSTARSLGVTNSFDPAQNIMGGAKYLRQMLDSFNGDVSKALAAYNAGPNAVRKYDGIPPYQETQNYVAKVLGYAGDDISIPAAGAPSGTSSSDSLTSEDLVDLLLRSYFSDSVSPQEHAQMLAWQLLSRSEKESDEDVPKGTLQMYI